MAPLSCIECTPEERAYLLSIARRSIRHGLRTDQPLTVAADAWPGAPDAEYGNFVTLMLADRLRGCIGSIEPTQPLAPSVAAHAFNAAFHDPRFPPLTGTELARTRIEISVLSTPEPVAAPTRAALAAELRPGEDGLLLTDGSHHATFLPKVWEQLPEPEQFIAHLRTKAGLSADGWSDTIRCFRYCTTSFAEDSGLDAAVGPEA